MEILYFVMIGLSQTGEILGPDKALLERDNNAADLEMILTNKNEYSKIIKRWLACPPHANQRILFCVCEFPMIYFQCFIACNNSFFKSIKSFSENLLFISSNLYSKLVLM